MGADEISGYLNVFIGFLALAFTLQKGGHVRVDIVSSRLPQKVRNILDILTDVLALILVGQLILTAWYSFKQIVAADERAQTYLLTPLAIPYGIMLFSWILFFAAIFIQLVRFIGEAFGMSKGKTLTGDKTADKEILFTE
jgi:TRAP-type C4-dicarboxylate transport system permease small subunit